MVVSGLQYAKIPDCHRRGGGVNVKGGHHADVPAHDALVIGATKSHSSEKLRKQVHDRVGA
jgi:hypothetical protein